MNEIKAYLLSVICASVISTILINIVDKKGACSALTRVLVSIFISIVVITPLINIGSFDFDTLFSEVHSEADKIILDGQYLAARELETIIKSNTEAYILSKATLLGMDVAVNVTLDLDSMVPSSVIIEGSASPYAKRRLQDLIMNDLGISKGDQTWI